MKNLLLGLALLGLAACNTTDSSRVSDAESASVPATECCGECGGDCASCETCTGEEGAKVCPVTGAVER